MKTENSRICSQCRQPADGVLFERTPPYNDIFGDRITPMWERVGSMCTNHLDINGRASISNGFETRIEYFPDNTRV